MSSSPAYIHVEAERPELHKLDSEQIRSLAALILQKLGIENWELSITFVGPHAIQQLNADFRNKNTVTDVLSFPQEHFEILPSLESPAKALVNQDGPPRILGDIVVCPERAEAQATEIGHSLSRETAFLMIHGILHLCGYDHQNPEDEAVMISQQKSLLALVLGNLQFLQEKPLLSIHTIEGIT